MRAGPAGGHELLVGEHHRGAVDAERAREISAGRELEARRQHTLADEPLQLGLDLPGQRHRALTVDRDLHGRPNHFGQRKTVVNGQLGWSVPSTREPYKAGATHFRSREDSTYGLAGSVRRRLVSSGTPLPQGVAVSSDAFSC